VPRSAFANIKSVIPTAEILLMVSFNQIANRTNSPNNLKLPSALYNQTPKRGQWSQSYEMIERRKVLIVSNWAYNMVQHEHFLTKCGIFSLRQQRSTVEKAFHQNRLVKQPETKHFSLEPWLCSNTCAIVEFHVAKHDSANPTR
jgi:hypothetical protein